MLISNKKNHYEFTVKDNGIGFSEDFDIENPEKLSLQLVKNLINPLDGELKLNMETGTKFKIKFKELEYNERL
jgi:two-component sensor histidine kinase